ncbi:MAG TPA: RNA methyltransferase [Gemmatimonadales bacterium]
MGSNLVSLVRDLQRRRGRKRRALTVAEGIRLVEEALSAGVTVRGALVTASATAGARGAALVASLAAHAIPVELVEDALFGELADTENPQGVLAVIDPRRWSLTDVTPARRAPVLVLDGVQDPGNVGNLVRTAFALGAAGTLMLRGTADTANPKVVRAAMGATFKFPIVPLSDGEFTTWVAREGIEVWSAATEGTPFARAAVPDRLAIVVGNEGAGVRPHLRAVASRQVAIPLARGAESLNVAVAAGILLHEVVRGA